MQIEEVYIDLFQFLERSTLEQKQFIFDEEKSLGRKTAVSLNGVFDLETIKTIISCMSHFKQLIFVLLDGNL